MQTNYEDQVLLTMALRNYIDKCQKLKDAKGKRELTERAKEGQQANIVQARNLLSRILSEIPND